MATARPNQIPDFIAASSPKLLRRLMIKTNAKHGTTIQYFDIQNVGSKWYAWFYLSINTETIRELSDEK